MGFTVPPPSPGSAVGSYPTVSPLLVAKLEFRPVAVCFLWHFPSGHPAWALPSTLPCGARTFLTLMGAATRPTCQSSLLNSQVCQPIGLMILGPGNVLDLECVEGPTEFSGFVV